MGNTQGWAVFYTHIILKGRGRVYSYADAMSHDDVRTVAEWQRRTDGLIEPVYNAVRVHCTMLSAA